MRQVQVRLDDSANAKPSVDFEEISRRLLLLVDVVRDPVHGDIRLTKLERAVVNLPLFQRLRNMLQLGMTYIVYPGAVHTRFLHSLGALHVCSRLIASCQTNVEMYASAPPHHPHVRRLSSYTILLARLSALIHDMAHVPFGHTFDKEAQIFPNDEWKDPARVEKIFGPSSEVGLLMRERFFAKGGAPKGWLQFVDTLLDDMRAVVSANTTEEIESLRFPFVHDLVGNTICADLIDYVQRDMYFCGLVEKFGDRFLEYVAVVGVCDDQESEIKEDEPSHLRTLGGKELSALAKGDSRASGLPEDAVFEAVDRDGKRLMCRVALLQYRYNEDGIAVVTKSVYKEAIDLVRRRLAVAEKLYFHRTKVVASVMVAEAAYCYPLKSAMDIWELTDREVLRQLARLAPAEEIVGSEDHQKLRGQILARKVIERHLLKPVYRASYTADELHNKSSNLRKKAKIYRDMRHRLDLVMSLEKCIALATGRPLSEVAGSVVMSCPRRGGNAKGFDMLVMADPDALVIQPLQDLSDETTHKEIDAIQTAHEFLWQLEVFVDTSIVPLEVGDEALAEKIARVLKHKIGQPNSIARYLKVKDLDLEQWSQELRIRAILAHEPGGDAIPMKVHEELCQEAFRGYSDKDLRELVQKRISGR